MANFNGRKDIDREKAFWSKVDIKSEDECWEYKAGKCANSYGQFWDGKLHILAHRYAWELSNKTTIPKGMFILHKCDNPLCCNPNHLYCGTQTDNMGDMIRRHRRGMRAKGKLYAGEIWLIRRLNIAKTKHQDMRFKHKISASTVCKMFKVSYKTILNIWNTEKYLCKEGYYI